MVYIKSADGVEKKYACIKCIKGHRSSKCTHQDRELFEIKRKGRPVSQCETCRLLRKTKQVHIKCMCHLKTTDNATFTENAAKNGAATTTDQVFRYSELCSSPTSIHSNTSLNVNTHVASTSCPQCDRPKLYCICSLNRPSKHESISSSNSSEDGSLTPPIYTNASTSTSAGLNHHQGSLPSSPSSQTSTPYLRHPTIPIHDPSDDIDSDTPIYKSVEEVHSTDKSAVLGEFSNKSSEELMNQIYSGFHPLASAATIKEEKDELVELAKEDS